MTSLTFARGCSNLSASFTVLPRKSTFSQLDLRKYSVALAWATYSRCSLNAVLANLVRCFTTHQTSYLC